jgi:TRAP-type transport system periplasmic protein
MKRTLIFSIIFVLIFSLMSIAQTTSNITIDVASTFPPDSPQDQGLVKFKELVSERSDGRIEVQIHPSSAMGDEQQTFELLSQGSVEYGLIGTVDISTYFPKYSYDIPYIFSSQEDFWKFWDGPGKEIAAMIEEERGVRTDGVIYRGARYLTANRPIESVEDVKGLKLRLPPVKAYFKVWEGLGAIPTNVAFGEVYMALKTGVVEAQENPPETILNYKFYEAQKYLIATKHVYAPARILSSAKWWNTMNKDDQDLLTKAMEEGVAYANSITKDGDEKYVKELQELGMTLIEVDTDAFKEAVRPIIDQLAEDELEFTFYEKVQEALK